MTSINEFGIRRNQIVCLGMGSQVMLTEPQPPHEKAESTKFIAVAIL